MLLENNITSVLYHRSKDGITLLFARGKLLMPPIFAEKDKLGIRNSERDTKVSPGMSPREGLMVRTTLLLSIALIVKWGIRVESREVYPYCYQY
jgi:hypothetical protein